MTNTPEVRPLEREAFCRVCDKRMPKGDMVFSVFTYRGRGQHIYICEQCCMKMPFMWSDGSSGDTSATSLSPTQPATEAAAGGGTTLGARLGKLRVVLAGGDA